MKELSIEEKARAYDEAIGKLRGMMPNWERLSYNGKTFLQDLIHIFPELKESEDEQHRKWILEYLYDGLRKSDEQFKDQFKSAIAWLEKKGEQKPAKNIVETWKDMRLEVYQQVSGNRHEPNYSDDTTKMFSLNDIDEIIEKMSEQNPTNDTDKDIVIADKDTSILDKVEPRFHEGEWITNGNFTWKIVEVKPLDYILQSQDGNIVDDTISHVDEHFHSFTIEDAKDGDVLAEDSCIFIVKKLNHDHSAEIYCCLHDDGDFDVISALVFDDASTYPATKEQRDLLFQKMKEAGYEWDADKKELSKIEQKPTDEEMKELLRTEYEKGRADAIAEMQEWNEENEETLKNIITSMTNLKDSATSDALRDIYNSKIDWLKSFKDKVQPQLKQEWSEKDEKMFKETLAFIETVEDINKVKDGFLDVKMWLKSLKDRVHSQDKWKPSDEQIKALKNAISIKPFENPSDSILWGLYEQLNKLKEE